MNELLSMVETKLREKFGDAVLKAEMNYDFPVFTLNKSVLYETLSFLKSEPGLEFGFLTTLAGVHYPEQGDQEFCMTYQLHNLQQNHRIRLKFFMPVTDMKVPSVTHLWPTANWMERQEYDFFGFKFTGHPDLRRILNMDEMNYFPMRKEYPLEDGSRDDKQDKMFGR